MHLLRRPAFDRTPRRRLPAAGRTLVLMTSIMAACADPNEPDDWDRAPARLIPSVSSVQAVAAPTEVPPGESFTVTVTSLGSSTCRRADVTDVTIHDNIVELRPWDRVAPPGPCTDDLQSFPHHVMLTAPSSGSLTVRVHAVLVDQNLTERQGTIEVVVQVR